MSDWIYVRDGLHMPQDSWVCLECNLDWMAEYDEDEEITCPYCKTKNSAKKANL